MKFSYQIQSILILFSLFFTFSHCASDGKEDNSNKQKPLAVAADCLKEKNRICDEGLFFAQIGDSLGTIKTDAIACKSVIDSLFSDEDMERKDKILVLENGTIVLEGTRVDKLEGTNEGLRGGHIAAIRIQTPNFFTAENIHVGSLFQELRKVYADSLFEIQPANTGQLQVRIPKISSIHYYVKEKIKVSDIPGADLLSVENIAEDATIEMIVVSH